MANRHCKPKHLVGVDLGGTKMLAGIFDDGLRKKRTVKLSTKMERGAEAVTHRIVRCVQEVVDEADVSMAEVRAVGVGVTGGISTDRSRILPAPHFDWGDFALEKNLEDALGVPVYVENDCNLATLGVHAVELKAKPRHMLGIFIGTHIGGGLVVNGSLYNGFTHAAGKLGHMVLDPNGPVCNCGKRGCFEVLASRTAVFSRIKTAISEGRSTVLTEALDNVDQLRNGDLRRAFRCGDPLVKEVVQSAALWMGIAIGNLVNVLNPEVVVLGGGMLEALSEEVLGFIIETANEHAMAGMLDGVEILTSSLGDLACITGGAWLARRKT